MLHSGLSKAKAVLYNLLSASLAIVGVIFGLLLGQYVESFTVYILPIAAAGFIYIATADLIPELHKDVRLKNSILQLLSFLLGIGLMALL